MTDGVRYSDGVPLWPQRYLTDGQLIIARRPTRPKRQGPTLLQRFGRWWRRLRRWQQWVLGFFIAGLVGGPFQQVNEDLGGAISVAVMITIGLLVLASRERPQQPALPPPPPPEVSLAASETTEARVAAAASRAWLETAREPAWQSPHLAHSRAAFDGQAEVDQIIDLALRIYRTRVRLGVRLGGPAGEYWDRQNDALERASLQLGERADALIRFRDQTGQLSAELQHLADLEDLERTALEIQDLTNETAPRTGATDGGLSNVADEIAGVRHAMTELLDLMTRTLTPLQAPPPTPPHLPR
jgi:hypothetical protein